MQGTADHAATSPRPSHLALRLGLVVLGLLSASFVLSRLFKSELQDVARLFYDGLGTWGAGVGSFLADGFSFPVPPQAYMLLAEANGDVLRVFPAIVIGSLAGGAAGYLAAPRLLHFGWVRAWVERTESKVSAFCGDRWFMTTLVAGLTPIAFSWLCYSAALYKRPRRVLVLLCALRIPKLAMYQLLISWGWS
jgi:hypothetical protein